VGVGGGGKGRGKWGGAVALATSARLIGCRVSKATPLVAGQRTRPSISYTPGWSEHESITQFISRQALLFNLDLLEIAPKPVRKYLFVACKIARFQLSQSILA